MANNGQARVMFALLVLSILALLCAPLLMPSGYSWLSNTISESAAQGVAHAWLARVGLMIYGLAVIWAAVAMREFWGAGARVCHLVFGLCMVAAAMYPIRPWDVNADYDVTEDYLHSLAATVMGFAYTFGVLCVYFQHAKSSRRARRFDLIAAAVATVFPLMMLNLPGLQGGIQRIMFLVSYVWYGREILRFAKGRGG